MSTKAYVESSVSKKHASGMSVSKKILKITKNLDAPWRQQPKKREQISYDANMFPYPELANSIPQSITMGKCFIARL